MNSFKNLELFTKQTSDHLFQDYNPTYCLIGELSSSALATAIALFTLEQYDSIKFKDKIAKSQLWLENSINRDGGFGDSPESKSNLSTSLLVFASIYTQPSSAFKSRLKKWITNEIGDMNPQNIHDHILSFYGDDKTFSAPILTMCCIAGIFDTHPKPWSLVPQLPFELASLPHLLFKSLNLNVVSYALPALIAIGICKHSQNKKSHNIFRYLSKNIVLKKLNHIQPMNGGFLEATPLTGFVSMSLIKSGFKNTNTVEKAIEFICNSMRGDGSWPIDTNLSTWVSSLAIKGSQPSQLAQHNIKSSDLKLFYLKQQLKTTHPYTMAEPGGWPWTNLPGGVPDADDTAAAIVVLSKLNINDPEIINAAMHGFSWLKSLQNSDGGIPTFCRGWGKLPFDKSCPDISAHVLEAIDVWEKTSSTFSNLDNFKNSLIDYLISTQHNDGYWLPLWFGNQYNTQQHNPVYGTAQVLAVIAKFNEINRLKPIIEKAKQWLLTQQNSDGSFGLTNLESGSIEETSLALTALVESGLLESSHVLKGYNWLYQFTKNGTEFKAEPIGLYFASLWYSEKKYPLCFLLRFLNQLDNS
jgi:prenyltransferase beta subunit